jgi:DNA-binding NarL/FixJ family response regulator
VSDAALKVAIFDDVLAARREVFHIPGLDVAVYGDADDVRAILAGDDAPQVVCMDYAMGAAHASGEDAIRAVRAAGYRGKIVAMSSDPAANARMIQAGANEHLPQKAMLRSYLVALGQAAMKKPADGG